MCRADESLTLAQGHDHATAGFVATFYRWHNIYRESYFLYQKFKSLGFIGSLLLIKVYSVQREKGQKTKYFNETILLEKSKYSLID